MSLHEEHHKNNMLIPHFHDIKETIPRKIPNLSDSMCLYIHMHALTTRLHQIKISEVSIGHEATSIRPSVVHDIHPYPYASPPVCTHL